MRSKLYFRLLLLISLLVAASLGCQLVDNITEGVKFVGTGRAVATDIKALTTQIIPPGLDETARALGTQVDESGVLKTAQAAITEKAPGIGETAQAIVTEVYTSPEEAPADIPIMDGEKSAFVGTSQAVSYFINAEFQDAVDFYKKEMPNKGWQADTSKDSTSENLVELHFTKDNRSATVVITQIPFVGQTTIAITIEGS
jgi:hypothetical protein